MESGSKNVIRVGSRKSELALIQTNHVIDCLKKINPAAEYSIVTMDTLGDRILDVSLPKIGEKALFTKDLEDALRSDTVDFVVHSLKDLPTSLPDGLAIGAVFEREDPRDALVLREDLKDHTLDTLPPGSVIGTSSLRRTAQLRGSHPLLVVEDVRGNLNTRLRKLDAVPSPRYSALLLATAGLQRMGWNERISKILPCADMLYAAGQGALGVQCRAGDAALLAALAPHSHAATYCRVLAERSFLRTLGGGCSAPVGVSTRLKRLDSTYNLSMTGAVWSLDGAIELKQTLDETFARVKRTCKRKLGPDDENENKILKIDNETNPIEVLNNKITEKIERSSCEDFTSCEDDNLSKNDGRIFCGLTVNTNVPIDVIIKCDNLGKNLAEALIEKGALEVMKISQDYIRNSTVKKT